LISAPPAVRRLTCSPRSKACEPHPARVVCVSTVNGEGEFTWLNLHNLSTSPITATTPFSNTRPISPAWWLRIQPAGHAESGDHDGRVNNELICNPSLLPTLTNSPYNLPIVDDLRGRFVNKYAVYGYLYTNYWPQCTIASCRLGNQSRWKSPRLPGGHEDGYSLVGSGSVSRTPR